MEVSASKMHERMRFCVELPTYASPTVTRPATSKLNTVKEGIGGRKMVHLVRVCFQ